MKLYNLKEITADLDGVMFSFYTNVTTNPLSSDGRPLHTHLYTEMFVCAKGCTVVNTATEKYILSAGDVLFLPAGLAHARSFESDAAADWLSIGITATSSTRSAELYKNICSLIKRTEPILLKNHPQLFETVKNLVNSATHSETLLPKIELLTELIKLSERRDIQSKGLASNSNQPPSDAMLNFEHILHHRYNQQLSVKELAKELCVGERQLYRAVKKHFGAPIHTLILQRRISVAQKALVATSDPIEKIALEAGFSNKVAFHRCFKQMTGTTPANYRRQHLK